MWSAESSAEDYFPIIFLCLIPDFDMLCRLNNKLKILIIFRKVVHKRTKSQNTSTKWMRCWKIRFATYMIFMLRYISNSLVPSASSAHICICAQKHIQRRLPNFLSWFNSRDKKWIQVHQSEDCMKRYLACDLFYDFYYSVCAMMKGNKIISAIL